ncbi:MAG: hypothetical protein KDA85_00850, partial [Planctomycetaceae bacterium]|nr:hypothetical protein [Planctomycetaceae bacterium]
RWQRGALPTELHPRKCVRSGHDRIVLPPGTSFGPRTMGELWKIPNIRQLWDGDFLADQPAEFSRLQKSADADRENPEHRSTSSCISGARSGFHLEQIGRYQIGITGLSLHCFPLRN